MNSRILLVEDEPDVRLVVTDFLRAEGYEPECARDGVEGLRMALDQRFDLLILDVMMPGMDGFELCRALRIKGYDGAVLMLTARGQTQDKVEGLRGGADDYLTKPFDPGELLARVEALLRRTGKAPLTPVQRFEFGAVSADFTSGEVFKAGVRVALAQKELQLLRCLVDNRGQVLSRDRLLKLVWSQQPFITPRTVDVHISWLRQKLEEDPTNPRFISTVRGEGYRFER